MKFKVGDDVVIITTNKFDGLTGKVVELLIGERHVVDELGNVYQYLVEVDKRHTEFIKEWPHGTIYCCEGHIDSNDILATKWIKRHEV
jgi:hypothetical protein